MSGAVTEAYSVLSAARAPKTLFVKKLEFANEVVSETSILSFLKGPTGVSVNSHHNPC